MKRGEEKKKREEEEGEENLRYGLLWVCMDISLFHF